MTSFETVFILVVYGIAFFELFLLSLNFRNAKLSKVSLPDNLRDVFSDDLIEKSVEYSRAKSLFVIVSSVVNLVALSIGIFWGFGVIESLSMKLAEGFALRGLIFFSLIASIYFFISLPFSIYSTFVLENRYGFNRTTPKTFVSDKIKEVLLAAGIGLPLVYLALLAIDSFEYWWVYLLIGVVGFEILTQLIFPTVILPLFYKLKPLEDENLAERIREIADRAGFGVKSILVMDASRKTRHTNAFFTGIGRAKRIVLYDSLLEKHSSEEIEAIFAHEAGHFKRKHILKGMLISNAVAIFAVVLLWMIVESDTVAGIFGVSEKYAILLYAGIFLSSIFTVLDWIDSFISRKWEFEADSYSAMITGDTQPMIRALKNLSVSNLSNLSPHPLYAALYYSHPPSWERIEKLNGIVSNIDERKSRG
ncbi:M48 family metallopeptidase [Mesotoga prima]|uniref:M48 family metallopeptidase n=1 Tax=Mesotoga prima TaxID=1184387 RepID=UPI002B5F50AA|nr:M48 family metallopeptidase [Mesotoga prima]HPA00283.1 M48 family metallopeptidase [Mesotoga prima]HUM22818.1 M48 family metallopeptidase [Mesotoga prima]